GDHSGAAVPGGAAALRPAVERGVGDRAHGGRKYSSGGALRGAATAQRRVAAVAPGLEARDWAGNGAAQGLRAGHQQRGPQVRPGRRRARWRRGVGHQGARRPVDHDRPGERSFDSGRWQGGSHPQHDRLDGSLHARSGGCSQSADGGVDVDGQWRDADWRDAGRRHCREPGMTKPVRVLVVDDSALMRKLIPRILEQDAAIEVVGTAIDGNFALKKIEDLSPEVITLDLEMPGLNGIDTLKQIMRRGRLPVIVVSSHSTAGASITLKALALGAFDFVAKPTDVAARMPEIASELIKKIRAAAQSSGVQTQFLPGETHHEQANKMQPVAPTRIIAIGVS